MRLAVDVMGGDHGPEELLHGIQLGLARLPDLRKVFVVGREPELRPLLSRIGLSDPRIEVHHAADVLSMEDKPVQALRRKKDASVLRAIELVKDGHADAVISAGNTGGIVAASLIRLRPLAPVERPTLACILPSRTGAFVLVDGGANPECTPENLRQFAVMGSAYTQRMLGVPTPRVGVLSNGTEDTKGTDLTRAALELIRHAPVHCIGYCEGYALFLDGVDVVVCDGFVGNIVLKTSESLGKCFGALLRAELTASVPRKLGALLAKKGLDNIRTRMNPEIYGGAPLLGINGCVIKIHGSARRVALHHAMEQSTRFVRLHLNDEFVRLLSTPPPADVPNPTQP